MGRPRMIVVGLDCAAPTLVFDRYIDSLPNLRSMMLEGIWGRLRSSDPPITVPAWTCMVTGRDAGELGLYGFRNRVPGQTEMRLASSKDVRVKRVWDWLGEYGFVVAPLFVPLTSPPTPVGGVMVSGFLWPGGDAPWCFPTSMEAEIESRFGAYRGDVADFRSDDPKRVLSEIYAITQQHFDIAEYVWADKDPDFMMLVEIGLDRFHHAFWHHIDPSHPKHELGNPWAKAGMEYYHFLDAQIGRLRTLAGPQTSFMIVSDHGAKPMRGGFCINDWLVRRGYLVLRDAPREPTRLDHDHIDWGKTRVWAEGGYYARIFLNVAGREPLGVLSNREAKALIDELKAELSHLEDDDGAPVVTRIDDPTSHYRRARGSPPDLMVYFDDLALRSIGTVGNPRRITSSNDTGPDSCNHDWDGVFIASGPPLPRAGRIEGATLYDVAPTILSAFGIPRPPGIQGRDWIAAKNEVSNPGIPC